MNILSDIKSIIKFIVSEDIIFLFRKLMKKEITFELIDKKNTERIFNDIVGYQREDIFRKVKSATSVVLDSGALWERDGTLFFSEEIDWHIMTAIGLAANSRSQNNKTPIQIVDFGGSLGSSYLKNKALLETYDFEWNIVEQDFVVSLAADMNFEGPLSFHPVSKLSAIQQIDLLIFSASLQYLSAPYELLDQLLENRPPFVLLDKTIFNDSKSDMLYLQRVPSNINRAVYPCWSFAKTNMTSFFEKKGYTTISETDSIKFKSLKQINSQFRMILFRRSDAHL